MASYFSFLQPGQDGEPSGNKVFVPQGWKIRKPGKDYWQNEETWADEGDELRGPDELPKATAEEMKPYTQRRGDTSSQVFQVSDRIIDTITKDIRFLRPDAEEAKRAVRANPDDAAKIIEKFYETAQKAAPGTTVAGKPVLPQLYGTDFSALENSVRSLRGMKRGPQEKALVGGLAQTDLKKDLSQLENLRGQLVTLTKEIASAKETMPEAVSKRGEQEQAQVLGDKQQKAAAIAEHIKQLEAMTAGAELDSANAADPAKVENNEIGTQPPPDADSALKAAGTNRERFLQKTAEFLKAIKYDVNERFAPSAFGIALNSMLAASGPVGVALMAGMNKGMKRTPNPQQQQQGSAKPGELQQKDPYQARIDQRQNEVMNAISEIKNLKTFDSGWKVALFIMFSVVLGPAASAALFTNKARRGELKFELDSLERDLSTLIRQQDQARRFQEAARHNAIMENQGQQRIEQDKYMDKEYLELRRQSPRGKDPVADQLIGSYRMWQDEVEEAETVLNDQFNFNDAEIKQARAKRARALPQLEAVRSMILKYRQRKLGEMQGQ